MQLLPDLSITLPPKSRDFVGHLDGPMIWGQHFNPKRDAAVTDRQAIGHAVEILDSLRRELVEEALLPRASP